MKNPVRFPLYTLLLFTLLLSACGRSAGQAKRLKVSGNIEATEIPLSFKLPGRMVARLVDEGQIVHRGEVIARLDDAALKDEAEARRADMEAAKAWLAELLAGTRPEDIAQVEASLKSAQADLDQLQKDFSRQTALFRRDVISQREYQASQARYEVARERVQEMKERLKLARKGPRVEQIRAARAKYSAAAALLGIAETHLKDAVLRSPTDGIVLSKSAEPGQFLGAGGTVVTVADLKHVWLRAFINETDLGRVKLGQTVTVTTDSYPGKTYSGRVSFISSEAEFTPKTIQTEAERVKLVYRIKVDVSNPDMELKPGMPADAVIRLEGPGA
ncbi:MAG: efflux RND transporter periplasmic adaptor subunit [Acidobacteriota bacterium]|jgi:HlyD family secretion protein